MRTEIPRRGVVLAAIILLGGCASASHDGSTTPPSPPAATTGALNVVIQNLPSGLAASVTVSNAAGYTQNLTSSQSLGSLSPASYTVAAAAVTASGTTYTPSIPSQTVVVAAGATADASVTYTATGVPGTYAAITPGFHTRSMTVDGVTRGYQIYIPPGYNPAVPQRVILFCHGSGENGTNNSSQIGVGLGKYITDNGNSFPDVVVFAQVPTLGDNAAGAVAVYHIYRTALDLTVAEVNIDPTRVLVTGVSSGATHTWMMAYQQPTRYAAMAPIAQWMIAKRLTFDDTTPFADGPSLAFARLPTLPIHEYYGENDANSSYQADQAGMAGNPNYALLVVPGADHTQSWDVTYASAAFWTWFRAQHR